MKDRRDIEIEIAELELCLSKVWKENPDVDNNWSLVIMLKLKAKIEALKWVLNAV